jgi:hypothetical protein
VYHIESSPSGSASGSASGNASGSVFGRIASESALGVLMCSLVKHLISFVKIQYCG